MNDRTTTKETAVADILGAELNAITVTVINGVPVTRGLLQKVFNLITRDMGNWKTEIAVNLDKDEAMATLDGTALATIYEDTTIEHFSAVAKAAVEFFTASKAQVVPTIAGIGVYADGYYIGTGGV